MAALKVRGGLPRFLAILVISFMSALQSTGGLTVGFYNRICPGAEATVRRALQARFSTDKTIAPGLLRMYFHDCFVLGCDASLLIKSKPGNTAEQDAGANLTVHGYDLIDIAKAAVEKICPGKVSCADIIALATRDAVFLAGGPNYQVPCGRRDGLVSKASNVNLPGPTSSVAQVTAMFGAKGLTRSDLVVLLGAHTVGVTHCSFFNDRLWNFQGTRKADPAMDPLLVTKLKASCPENGSGLGKAIALDQGTPNKVDTSFYSQLLAKRGILQLDQTLATDRTTFLQTARLASSRSTFMTADFAAALIKLGNVGVLQGRQGQIRRICSAIN